MQITEKSELDKLLSRADVKAELEHTKKKLEENLAKQGLVPAEGTWSAVIAIREKHLTPAILVRYRTPKGGWNNFLGSKKHNWYCTQSGDYIQEPDKFLDKYAHEVDQYAVFGCRHEFTGDEKSPRKFPGAFEVSDFLEILGFSSRIDAGGKESNHGAAHSGVAGILVNEAVEILRRPGRDKCTVDEILIKAKGLAESREIEWTKELEQECNDSLNQFAG